MIEKLECRICNGKYEHLANHLKIHDITPREYRKQYQVSVLAIITNEAKEKMSKAKIGKKRPDMCGENNPNYGKDLSGPNNSMYGKKRPDVTGEKNPMNRPEIKEKFLGGKNPSKRLDVRKKISKALLGENNPMYGRTGKKHHLYGKHHSEDTRKKISDSLTRKSSSISRVRGKEHHFFGKRPWNSGLTKYTDKRVRKYAEKISKTRKKINLIPYNRGKTLLELHGEKKANKLLKKWIKSNQIKPNKPEKKLKNLLDNIVSKEYMYTGNGDFIVGGKCPDFVNCNGQKKIIELFGDYWHDIRVKHSREKEEEIRKKHFSKYGFKTMIVWESDLNNEDKLIEKIKIFNKNDGE